jgi:cytosine/adenosine deaminase-related metal-dependent hydrolase
LCALLHLRDLDLVLAGDRVERGHLVLENGLIRNVGEAPSSPAPDHTVEGEGLTAFPGLINAHEHLVGTWSPRTGLGLHRNVYSWLDRYMVHPVRQERMNVPEPLIYRLGMYRNLLSGVTTVLDHFTRVEPSPVEGLPLRVLTDFGREWVLRSRTAPDRYPPWGEGIEREMAATDGKVPFVIHIAEGVDEECRGELARLAEAGGLHGNTVLVQGKPWT